MTTEQMDEKDDYWRNRFELVPPPIDIPIRVNGGEPTVLHTRPQLNEVPNPVPPYFDGTAPDGSEPSEDWTGAETTLAEEPIEDRLRRAFLNGFREGIEMASWRRGQWDFV